MRNPVRWYHRVAAWLWPRIGEPMMLLAEPVWAEEFEKEYAKGPQQPVQRMSREEAYESAFSTLDIEPEGEWQDDDVIYLADRVDPYDVGF